MYPIFNSNTPSIPATLANSYAELIDELQTLVFGGECQTKYDITKQIPLWVVYEKMDRESNGTNAITIFDFVQKYYDWLYCDLSSGAQYELSTKLTDLIDVEKTRSKFLERLATIYADGFDIKSLETYGGLVSEANLRQFIKNIRRTFYQKKTTEEGIRYLFRTLFGVDEQAVQIEIPKKFILRLNGGRFDNEYFSFVSGSTGNYENLNALSGSYLNGSRLQDGIWIQDWSYLLKVGIVASKYQDTYKAMAHPAGMKVVYEKTMEDYQGPTFDETIPFACELPMLKNYSPYKIFFNYSNSRTGIHIAPGWTANPEGITLFGLPTNTTCATGYTGFSGPTHLFPNWSEQVNVSSFEGINISTMLELCYPIDLGSPNDGASCG